MGLISLPSHFYEVYVEAKVASEVVAVCARAAKVGLYVEFNNNNSYRNAGLYMLMPDGKLEHLFGFTPGVIPARTKLVQQDRLEARGWLDIVSKLWGRGLLNLTDELKRLIGPEAAGYLQTVNYIPLERFR